jgi:hypothetical protein
MSIEQAQEIALHVSIVTKTPLQDSVASNYIDSKPTKIVNSVVPITYKPFM